jgi:NTP pyrophosphatase (non-canonical NTP hydrolase)
MIRELQEQVAIWVAKNFDHTEGWRPLLGVVEEVGELSHAHLKQVQGIRTQEKHQEKKIDAVADIVIFLCDYCNMEGIDLQKAIEETWKVVKKRDWQKNPKNADKIAERE